MAATGSLLAKKLAAEFGLDAKPLSEGSEALAKIFREQPVDLTTFVYDSRFLNFKAYDVTLGPIQYDFVRHFEQILFPPTYALMASEWGDAWTPVRFVNELIAEWG